MVGLVLLSALSYAFYVLFSKKVIHTIGAMWFTALAMSVSSLFVLIYYAFLLDWGTLIVSSKAWLWVILLALVSTVIPSFMISAAIAKIGSASTGIVGTLGSIMTIVMAVFILHEPFTLNHIYGMLLVVFGVLLLAIKGGR